MSNKLKIIAYGLYSIQSFHVGLMRGTHVYNTSLSPLNTVLAYKSYAIIHVDERTMQIYHRARFANLPGTHDKCPVSHDKIRVI